MLRSIYKRLVLTLLYILGYLPLPVLHACGFLIGTLIYLLPIRIRYYASTNIKLCFPQLSFWQHQLLLWRSLRESAKGWFEAPIFWVRSMPALLKLARNKEALQPLIEAVQQKRGALILGTHIGGYYLKRPLFTHYLKEIAYLYKPQKGILNDIMLDRRNRFGGQLVPTTKEGVLTLLRCLKAGGAVGMACDHNVLDHGALYTPFFGIPVPAMTLPSRLAQKTQAPCYMVFVERLSWGRGFKLNVIPADSNIYSPDLATSTRAVAATLEQAIRMVPTQHEWLYRRFWDRPEGEPSLYKTQK